MHGDLCKHLGIDLSTDLDDRYSNLFLNAYINRHAHTEYLKMLESDWIVGTKQPSFSGSLVLSMSAAANLTKVSSICRLFRCFLFRRGLYD